MWKVLEIFGRAVNIDTAGVMWHWLNTSEDEYEVDFLDISQILDHISNLKLHLADELIQSHLIDFPYSVKGLMAKATVELKRNNIENCIEILKKVCSLQAYNTMALYTLGYCYERQGQDNIASKYYQDCIKFKGYLQLPRQRLAAIYLKNGNINAAIDEYICLSKEYPDNTDSYLLLGYLYLANLEYSKAIDAFNCAITLNPENFQDNDFENIDELIDAGHFQTALDLIEEKLANLGELPEMYIKLGDIYLKKGELGDAVNCLNKALRIQPNNLHAVIKLATIYLRNGYISLAAENFNRALELNDEVIDAYIGLAKAQLLSGQVKNAIDTISLGSAIEQNSTLLYCEAATLQYMLAKNNTQKQTVTIAELIKLHQGHKSENSDSYYKTGLITLASADYEKACKMFEKALKINPYHFRAKSKLILSKYELYEKKQALELLRETNSLDKNILELHYNTAILYTNRDKFENAMEKLYNSMKENYLYAESVYNISVVLENIGLVDRAAANFVRLEQTCHR